MSEWVHGDSLNADLESVSVPSASGPFHVHQLHFDPPTKASAVVVRFPAGWTRTAGMYTCAEHAVVLDGEVQLDGIRWKAGEGFVVPAFQPRHLTFSPGALVIAWFSGRPVWQEENPASNEIELQIPSPNSWTGDEVTSHFDVVSIDNRKWRHVASDEDFEVVHSLPEIGARFYTYSWPKTQS